MTDTASNYPRIAAIIPAYKVRPFVLDVIAKIGAEVERIYVIDDACPDQSGKLVAEKCNDPRVEVLFLDENRGVGGAVMAGYKAALDAGLDIFVKIDGDGQMDPALLDDFVTPIALGYADYTKGNRFYDLENIGRMPKVRIFGNAALSFMTKLSTGYWDLFDPANGYTAIHREAALRLPMKSISKRYFFETDMLFRLGTLRAKVMDVPMDAQYGDEVSNLKISKILGEFLGKHLRNFCKRIFYSYFLRDMSIASLELLAGLIILTFGIAFGAVHWMHSYALHIATPTGTVMISALSILCGLQLLLAFLNFDFSRVPKQALHLTRHPRNRKHAP
ncbi:MAG TPA: glycosyltransferase family 2 protein [Dyella sp.]|uniref:glycosyltransferase family 2 protein n=1 Tax=Dyella sp. TaxID=1869338 RepID=UPI002F948185